MTTGGEFFRWLGQAIVVVFGWWVVHHLSSRRDLEKARREIVAGSADRLTDAINALLVEAREYHLAVRCVSRELHIKMALQDLAITTSGLSDICPVEAILAPCRMNVAALRRAITGLHFEDEHCAPLHESDQQFQTIAEAVLRAKRSFLKLKHHQFPPS